MGAFNTKHIDWLLVAFIAPLIGAGLVTMKSFLPADAASASFFSQQLVWVGVSFVIFLLLSFFDFRFLKKTKVLVAVYLFFLALLGSLFLFGSTIKGSTSWYDFGSFSCWRNISLAGTLKSKTRGTYLFLASICLFRSCWFSSSPTSARRSSSFSSGSG